MKTLFIAVLLIAQSSLNAQTFITMQAGTSSAKDIALHTAIGYQAGAISFEAGCIAAPAHTSRPFFVTGVFSGDIPIAENVKIVPLAGMAYKIFTAEQKYSKPLMPYGGVRLQWKDYFFQSGYTDKTVFLSVGMKGFFVEKY